MDDIRFDRLTAAFAGGSSRRRLLGLLLGATLGGLPARPLLHAAKKKNKKKKKQCPFGRPRCGNRCCLLEETCQRGRCKHRCQDGVKNLGETDKDCGRVCTGLLGANGRCQLRKTCEVGEDCRSGFCEAPPSEPGKICAECRIDADCTNLLSPRCLDNFCFSCAIDADCPGPLGGSFRFCRAMDICPRNQPCVCRECRQDSDCLSPEFPHCQLGTDFSRHSGICFACLEDGHCPAERPHCTPITGSVLSAGRCVECVEDTDCPAGHLCEQNSCVDECADRTRGGRVQAEGDNCPATCESDDECPSGFCCDDPGQGPGTCVFCPSGCCDGGECVTTFDDNVAHCGACGNSCPGQFPSCVRCCNRECKEFSRDGNPDCDCP